MELLNALMVYFRMPETQYAVLLPGLVAILALFFIQPKERMTFFALLVFSTLGSYLSARWEVTEEMRNLFILPCAFFSVCGLLWAKIPVSVPTAFAATFLSLWTVDMAMAMQLVHQGEASWLNFYYGVGGAGTRDALYLLPVVSAIIVPYALWRHSQVAKKQAVSSLQFA